jgi:hypothetical protein
VIDNITEIQVLEKFKTYKYLEYEKYEQMKERMKHKHNRRLRMILKSELNGRNKITAIGTLEDPLLR